MKELAIWLILIQCSIGSTLSEFATLSRCWKKSRCFECASVDYDKTGIVNNNDLKVFVESWLNMANKIAVFDGTGYITAQNDPVFNFGCGSFTFCFSAKILTNSSNSIYLFKHADIDAFNYERGYKLLVISNAETVSLMLSMRSGTSLPYYDLICGFLNTGQLTNVVLRVDMVLGVYNFTIDGDIKLDKETGNVIWNTIPQWSPIGSSDYETEFTLGKGAYLSHFSGSIDDFRIYKAVLTDADITELYNCGTGSKYDALASGKTAAFVMQFDNNFDADSKIYDAINGLIGTRTGGVTIEDGGVPYTMVPVSSHFTTNIALKQKLSKLAADNNLLFSLDDTDILLRRLENAYNIIADTLMARGLTEVDISTWRRGEEFQLDIATFWYAKDCGWGGKTIDEKDWTKIFDRRAELFTVSVVTNSGAVLCSGKGPVATGFNLMDISKSLGHY